MALVSPLDALGTALFSAHMGQHLVLMIPASLLLVLGAPTLPTLPTLHALPRGTMRAPVVWLLNAVVVCAWHMPALYDAALANEAVHALEHASFLGVSALLWAVVFPRRPHRPGQGSGILLMVGTGMQGGLLAAMLASPSGRGTTRTRRYRSSGDSRRSRTSSSRAPSCGCRAGSRTCSRRRRCS